jgi:mannose-6-phosphate isomerase-like protein (cupin superfamily)
MSLMKIVKRDQANEIRTPHGSTIYPLMDRTTSDIVKCSLAEELLPRGAMIGAHHHNETEEIYYILAGSGSMRVGEKVRRVEAGDSVFIPAGSIHTLHNDGNEDMRLLLICGPAYSPDDHIFLR